MSRKTSERGFTLIEILVVIGIIAVLAAIVLVAINPALRFAQAQNNQRTSNMTAILDAVGQYTVDKQGDFSLLDIADADDGDLREEIDGTLCSELIPTYIAAMPTDPDSGSDGASLTAGECAAADPNDIDYFIIEEGGRITICAPNADNEDALDDPATTEDEAPEICVSR